MKLKILFLSSLILISILNIAQNQKVLLKPVTATFSNQTLRSALNELEMICNIHFTYNSDIVNERKMINKNFKDTPLENVLNEIVGKEFVFNLFGSQVIISPKQNNSLFNEPKTEIKNTTPAPKPKFSSTPIPSPKTEIIKVYDTVKVKVYDTTKVTVINTINVTDTITIYETKTVDSIGNNKYGLNLFLTSIIYSSDLGTSIPNPHIVDDTRTAHSQIKGSVIGFDFSINYNKFNFYSGIGISQFYDNFTYINSYTYTDSANWYYDTISYWKYNVIDDYYKFISGESVKISVLDSTFTDEVSKRYPKAINNITERQINEYIYFSLPLGLRYKIFQNKDKRIYGCIGMTPMFLLYSNSRVYNYNNTLIELSKSDIKKFQLAAHGSLRLEQYLTENSSFFVQPDINLMLISKYKSNYYLHRRNSTISITCGISMYFN